MIFPFTQIWCTTINHCNSFSRAFSHKMHSTDQSVTSGPHSQTMACHVRDPLISKAEQPQGSVVLKLFPLWIWPLGVRPSATRLRCSVGNGLIMSLLTDQRTRAWELYRQQKESYAGTETNRDACMCILKDRESRNLIVLGSALRDLHTFHFTSIVNVKQSTWLKSVVRSRWSFPMF